MTYQESYQTWLDFADLPDYLREELVAMDEKTKEDAFYTNLEFGTAGMRGYIGAGTNRINVKKLKNVVLQLLMTHVTSHQNLPLNLLKFWQHMVSNHTSLKAFVQLPNSHLQFVIIMLSQVSW